MLDPEASGLLPLGRSRLHAQAVLRCLAESLLRGWPGLEAPRLLPVVRPRLHARVAWVTGMDVRGCSQVDVADPIV
jgi:hypothetical protein